MSRRALQRIRYEYEQKVAHRLDEIRNYFYSDCVPVEDIGIYETAGHISVQEAASMEYTPVDKGYKWGDMWSTAWFRLRFTVPDAFRGEPVALLFDCGGEAVAFIDSVPVQGLDRNRDDITLLDPCKGGEEFEVFVEAGANSAFGHFSEKLTLSRAEVGVLNKQVRDYYYDLQACSLYIDTADRGETRSSRLLRACSVSVDLFDYRNTDRYSLRESADRAAEVLIPELKKPAHSSEQVFACAGHAHLDIAWWWPVAETVRKCARTFSTVVRYMDEYPEYRFSQSQPQLYEFTKQRYPALYKRIREKISDGQWEPVGCMWVEADCNVTSGESLVRQILFGTRFFREEFGREVNSLWLPDVFGYSASLPQILRKSGMDYFTTQKISWSQYTVFPYHTFFWEGIDGTRILSHFPPCDSYNCSIKPKQILGGAKRYNEKDRVSLQLHQYGYGDGGGGPTRNQIERIRRYRDFEGMPRTEQMSSSEFFEKIEEESAGLPEWVGELYLELHRATLTTQAYNKRNNRKSELVYRDAELWSSAAVTGGYEYRQEDLNCGWKRILLNQFHDILPGSSIGEVYEETDRDYEWILELGREIRQEAESALCAAADTHSCSRPAVVFNSLSWERTGIAVLDGIENDCIAAGPSGETYVQAVEGRGYMCADVPSMGYAVYDLLDRTEEAEHTISVSKDAMENSFFRIGFDENGEITGIMDKRRSREILSRDETANVFTLFEDKPNSWPAWDMDVFYNDKPLETACLDSSETVASGPVAGICRQVKTISSSRIIQDILIYSRIPRIDFRTEIEWGDEKEVLLKVAFPVDVLSDKAVYEIQFGCVERPTHWNRPSDLAMFEVCAHKWADLSEGNYGVSLLNDCKYGYDIKGNRMRLTLLRASKSPDPAADVNKTHCFTYSLYPHEGDFRQGTVRRGYELNVPLRTVFPVQKSAGDSASESFLSVDSEHIVIDTVKKCEDDDSMIIRVYEAHKTRGKALLQIWGNPAAVYETDLMEHPIKELTCRKGYIEFEYRPFEIKTFKVEI